MLADVERWGRKRGKSTLIRGSAAERRIIVYQFGSGAGAYGRKRASLPPIFRRPIKGAGTLLNSRALNASPRPVPVFIDIDPTALTRVLSASWKITAKIWRRNAG